MTKEYVKKELKRYSRGTRLIIHLSLFSFPGAFLDQG
jgi:hypothetical protein